MIEKDFQNRIAGGILGARSAFAGILGATSNVNRDRVRKCLEWKKVPYKNEFKCSKFVPPKQKVKKIKNKEEETSATNRLQEEIDLIIEEILESERA